MRRDTNPALRPRWFLRALIIGISAVALLGSCTVSAPALARIRPGAIGKLCVGPIRGRVDRGAGKRLARRESAGAVVRNKSGIGGDTRAAVQALSLIHI